jgi:ABC-type bacteriocin/lantibiotic exporter with double-glycine peptidase domain
MQNDLKKMLYWLRNQRTIGIISYISLAASSFMMIAYAEILQGLTNGLAGQDLQLIRVYSIVLILALLLHSALTVSSKALLARFHSSVLQDMRVWFFDRINLISLDCIDAIGIGRILTYYNDDIKALVKFICLRLPNIIADLALFIGILAYLLTKNVIMTVVIITVSTLVMPFYSKIAKRLNQRSKEKMHGQSNLMILNENIIRGFLDIKTNNAQNIMLENHIKAMDKLGSIEQDIVVLNARNNLFLSFQNNLGLLAILLASGVFIHYGYMEIGGIVAIYSLFSRFSGTIRKTVSYIADFAIAKSHQTRLEEYMNLPVEHQTGEGFDTIKPCNIELCNVSFSYQNSSPVINNLTLDIKEGIRAAFVGANGCGKSTLVKLFCGYSDDYKGDIYIQGSSIRQVNLTEMRKKVMYVSMDYPIYRELLADEALQGADVQELIGILDMRHIVPDVKNGLIDGDALSGGERQRIILLIAYLKHADVYIFDEMLSYIGSDLAVKICSWFNKRGHIKSIIWITHRMELLPIIDDIYFFDRYKIVQHNSYLGLKEGSIEFTEFYREYLNQREGDIVE